MTVERLVMGAEGGDRYEQEHVARYRFAAPFVAGHRVVDVACGSGYGTKMLAEAGAADVVGVDVAAEAVSDARAQYASERLRYEVGDAQSLSQFANESLDVVVSFETVEHVPDDAKYVEAIHRVLRPGGTFLVSTPEFRCGSIRQRLTGKPRNPFHLREYTGPKLLALLRRRFVVEAVFGQILVSRWRLLLPVEVVTKAVAYKLFGSAGQSYIQSKYYPSDVSVQPMDGVVGTLPGYWIVCCRKAELPSQ